MKLTRTHMTILGGVLAAALAAPASSLGAVTIGSNLSGTPNDNLPGYCPGGTLSCTATNLSSTTPAGGGLTSPISGVVVKWSTKSGSSGNPVTFRVLRPAGGASFTGAGTGTTGTTTGGTDTFSTQTRIQAGDSVGLNPGNSALVFASGAAGDAVLVWGNVNGFPNGLTDGTTGAGGATGNKQVMVQAVVEPDADNDGLGDETQDPCPTQPGAVCTTGNDKTRPKITRAEAKPKKFAVNKTALSSAVKKITPRGTTFRFKLSEPATVTFTIERKTIKVTNGRKRTVYKRVGKFVAPGAKGKNAQPFTGRIKKKSLKPGPYRAVLSAVDGSKNKSKTATATFAIIK